MRGRFYAPLPFLSVSLHFSFSRSLCLSVVYLCAYLNYTLRLQGRETSGISALLLGTPKVIKLTYLSIDD